jgi:hypothetical protein
MRGARVPFMMQRIRHVCVMLCVSVLAGAAGGQITVDAPASNDPYVNSPFYLQAEATTCNSLPTASMAWSYDSNKDNLFTNAQSIQTMVTISDDTTPTLHVKAWNTNGALCETNLQLNIGGGVTVSTPAQGGAVSSPFTLKASSPTCGGQTTSSMAYNLDSTTGTTYSGAQSINTSVSAAAGWHILRAKAWGDGSAYCETDLHIDSSGSAGLVPPGNAQSYPNLEGSSAWETQKDAGTNGYPNNDGSTTYPESTPVYTGDTSSRLFDLSTIAASGGGIRWFNPQGENQPTQTDPATHFQYDVEVYIPDVSEVMNIEMDVNHSISSPHQVYILGVQCALDDGAWEVTTSAGWVKTNIGCSRSTITSAAWHHFQIQTHHDASGGSGVHYDYIAVDGTVSQISSCTTRGSHPVATSCVGTVDNLQWSTLIGPNFQLDGQTQGGSAKAYVDNFTIYYW